MFNSARRVTAVAIRLRDPSTLAEASARLQEVPGAQVVTQTEMMGTFLNILGAVRALLRSIGLVALFASTAGLINTLLLSVAERAFEFSLFRAIGASRGQLFGVVLVESMILTLSGVIVGIVISLSLGGIGLDRTGIHFPYLHSADFAIRPGTISLAFAIGFVVALIASFFPARRAMQIEPARALKGAE